MNKRAVVFAGQGAQSVGMGKDLAEAYPACRALYERADAVLGFSLSKVCFEGPDTELTKSNNCQPAIFVTSVACYTALQSKLGGAVTFAGMAGLSLGEWTALHLAGVLSFEDTLKVLEARGRFMQQACEEQVGGMVSVMGLGQDKLREICAQSGVQMANINSTDQIVLSGAKAGVEAAEKLAQAAGAKRTIPLKVAGAFHSALMQSAATRLTAVLDSVTFQAPAVPVAANVLGGPHGAPAAIKQDMLRQITQSVNWLGCVEWFRQQGVTEYVECGPGKVLSGLIKRIDPAAVTLNVQDAATADKTAAALLA